MNEQLLTLATHTKAKARILKDILEKEGVSAYLEKVDDNDSAVENFYIKVKATDLTKAMAVIEANQLFSYSDQDTYKIDDGRRRILVAVDFSSYSIKACQVAFNIAQKTNAKVKILHVYNNIYFPSHIPFADNLKESPEEGLLNTTRKQMLSLCWDIDQKITDKEWPSVNYSYSIREGIVEEEIDNFVLEYKPFLLILGTKGSHANQNNFIGDVTADVIEMTNVPVLAVPAGIRVEDILKVKHIAILTNLQSREMTHFHKLVTILSLYSDIKITLVHIINPDRKKKREVWSEQELDQMKTRFIEKYKHFNIDYELIDSPDTTAALASFIEEKDVTVICLNTRRRNLFGRIFVPSVSRKLLERLNTALLVLRG